MNSNFRNLALWAIIAVLLIALFNLFQSPTQRAAANDIPYSQFLDDVNSGKVSSVTISGQQIVGVYNNNTGRFETYAPEDPGLVEKLENKGVSITAAPPSEGSAFGSFLFTWLPDVRHSWRVDILHAPDAGIKRQGDGFWQVEGQDAHRDGWPRDL